MSAAVSTGIRVTHPLDIPPSPAQPDTLVDPPPDPLRRRNWPRIRAAAAGAYGAALVGFVLTEGVPTERLALFTWILTGLLIGCLGRGWRAAARLVLDWLPFVAVLVLYDLTRGMADTLGMPVHVSDLAAAESWLFGGTLPTVWLQDELGFTGDGWEATGQGAWWHVVVSAVYLSHFLVTPIVAAVLWLRNRQRWIAYTAHVIGVALVGVTTYILVPAAPPWYAAARGVIPPVERLSGLGWDVVGLHSAGALLDHGQAKVNLVAAIPSLHTAFAVLVLLFFWPVLNRIARALLALYPLLMGLILVYSGEHYVIDVLAGWVCAGIVASGLALIARLWRRHRAAQAPSPAPAQLPLVAARSAD